MILLGLRADPARSLDESLSEEDDEDEDEDEEDEESSGLASSLAADVTRTPPSEQALSAPSLPEYKLILCLRSSLSLS